MIEHPERFLEDFAEAGSDSIIVHHEGAVNLHLTVQQIRALNMRVGVAINPATPADVLQEILPDVDLVLVMTVNPGFGGQSFIHNTLAKLRQVRELVARRHPDCEIEVDGGIDAVTAPLVLEAGAQILAAGSSVFAAPDGVTAAMDRLRESVS